MSSVGKDKLMVDTYSFRMNGINGTTPNVYFSKRVLDHLDDEYGGVVINPENLPSNPSFFASVLRSSLSRWMLEVAFFLLVLDVYVGQCGYTTELSKRSDFAFFYSHFWAIFMSFDLQGKKGVWLKLPLEKSELVPVAVKVEELTKFCHFVVGFGFVVT